MSKISLLFALLLVGCVPLSSQSLREQVVKKEINVELFKACQEMCAGKVDYYAIFEGRCQCDKEDK